MFFWWMVGMEDFYGFFSYVTPYGEFHDEWLTLLPRVYIWIVPIIPAIATLRFLGMNILSHCSN